MARKTGLALVALLLVLSLPAHDQDPWTAALAKTSSILAILDNSYYQELEGEEWSYSAIRGMLETLDPHSYFLDPESFSRMREDYTGKFFGLGIQIQKQEDRIVVVGVVEGTPAWRLGLQVGDVISAIEGETTKPISSFDAMQKLRGERGTKVTITVVRDGLDKPFDLTVIREEIPLNSVPYAFILRDGVGYVFIRNFAERTDEELADKLDKLKGLGMRSLILDLRGNQGGPLVQAIAVADEFLPRGALVVSMRGRNKEYNNDFRAYLDNQHEKLPLIILINEGTASASEIVSGAVMDHDRGLIVGEDSWGKGLVQTVKALAPNMAVALTTAKYLTPSGRSIQRDYTNIDDYYLNKPAPDTSREVRYTDKGRKVLGQGGITPDYKVEFNFKPLTGRLILSGAFFSYARKLVGHQTELSRKLILPGDKESGNPAPGRIRIADAFTVDQAVIEDFKAYLRVLKVEYDEASFKEAEPEIRRELEREVYSAIWGIEEGIRIYRQSDPVVLKALEVMPEAGGFVDSRS